MFISQVSLLFYRNVCVCVYFTVESLLTFRRCHEDRTFRRFPFCYETAVQMLLFYKDGYLRLLVPSTALIVAS